MIAAFGRRFRLAVLLLLVIGMPTSVLLELAGDCDFTLEAAGSRDATCVHGHDDSEDEQPDRCPTDHHSASRCGCSCHHSSTIPIAGPRVTPVRAGFMIHGLNARLPERRNTPPLRPPIAC